MSNCPICGKHISGHDSVCIAKDDVWVDLEPGLHRLVKPSPVEESTITANAKQIGKRVRRRLFQRLLERAETVEEHLFWTKELSEIDNREDGDA